MQVGAKEYVAMEIMDHDLLSLCMMVVVGITLGECQLTSSLRVV